MGDDILSQILNRLTAIEAVLRGGTIAQQDAHRGWSGPPLSEAELAREGVRRDDEPGPQGWTRPSLAAVGQAYAAAMQPYAAAMHSALGVADRWQQTGFIGADGVPRIWDAAADQWLPASRICVSVVVEREFLERFDAALPRAERTRADQIVALMQRWLDEPVT